jgi:uncharacterized phage protein (TIGR02220 family)
MKWRKVYRDDPASSFTQLDITTKAIAARLLVEANEAGVLAPQGENPAMTICKSIGIPTRHRKLWLRCLGELLRDGWLVSDSMGVRIKNFARFQSSTKRTRSGPECAPSEPETYLNDTLVGANYPISLTPKIQKRREEKRVEKKRVKSLSSSANSTTKQVFEYWRSELKPRSKFDAKRRARIAARLKEGFTVEQLKTVVDKAKTSPHHSGKNDRGRTYQDIHTIFRDAAQVEAFLDGHHDKPTMKANSDEAEYQAKLARIKKHFT